MDRFYYQISIAGFLADSEVDVTKKVKWNELYIKFAQTPTEEQKDLLRKAIEHSRKAYGV